MGVPTRHVLILCLVVCTTHFAGALVCYKKLIGDQTCRKPTSKIFTSAEKCCSSRNGKAYFNSKVILPGKKNKFQCTPCEDDRSTTTTLPYETTAAPVDGEWGEWACWGSCSPTCGSRPGTQTRQRQCNNPSPQHGGKSCSLSGIQSKPCQPPPCPVDGGWSVWEEWFSCSVSCAGGRRVRLRVCNNPRPQHGGKYCEGKMQISSECNAHPCPVDGRWNEWSQYGPCSVTCAAGYRTRIRTCNPPKYNGADCIGDRVNKKHCKLGPCPVDGYWRNWGDWGDCSVTCGRGSQTRRRVCIEPKHGGQKCHGSNTETRQCDAETEHCPVDGGWSSWGETRRCSAPRCGGPGFELKYRKCNNPKPQYNGKPCDGLHYNKTLCTNNIGCPIDGNWCKWEPMDECNKERDSQRYKRVCQCPFPQNKGSDCVLNVSDSGKKSYGTVAYKSDSCIKVSGGCSSGSGSGSGSGDGSFEDQECDQSGSGSGDGSDGDAES